MKQAKMSGALYRILTIWQARRPKMVRKMRQMGILQEELEAALDKNVDHLYQLLRQGVELEAAMEIAEAEWILLPTEKDQPELSPDKTTLLSSETTTSPTKTSTSTTEQPLKRSQLTLPLSGFIA